MPRVPIRWVLVRDPGEKFEPQVFLCTKPTVESQQILAWFVRRWTVEVTFEEARAHLGVETQRQWSDKAIARTTPCLLGLYSVVTLMAGRVLARRAVAACPPRSVVQQTERDLRGHDCLGTALLVESSAFSNVGNKSREDKSPALVIRAPNRDAVLCSVNG